MSLPPEIDAAIISALVSLLTMYTIEGIIKPSRKKTLRKQLLRVWISYMQSNLDVLERDAEMKRLVIDNRPLDRLALYHRDLKLVEEMTSLRSQTRDFNRMVDFYEAMVAANAQFLFRPTPRKVEREKVNESERDKITRQMKEHTEFFVKYFLKRKKHELLAPTKKVKDLLEQALAREGDAIKERENKRMVGFVVNLLIGIAFFILGGYFGQWTFTVNVLRVLEDTIHSGMLRALPAYTVGPYDLSWHVAFFDLTPSILMIFVSLLEFVWFLKLVSDSARTSGQVVRK